MRACKLNHFMRSLALRAELYSAFNAVKRSNIQNRVSSTNFTWTCLILNARRTFHLQELGNEKVLRQITDSFSRHKKFIPTMWTCNFVSGMFSLAPSLHTFQTVRMTTWKYSGIRIHFCAYWAFYDVIQPWSTCVQRLRCRHFAQLSKHTPWAIKKGATFIFTITLANVDRFQ